MKSEIKWAIFLIGLGMAVVVYAENRYVNEKEFITGLSSIHKDIIYIRGQVDKIRDER